MKTLKQFISWFMKELRETAINAGSAGQSVRY